MSSRRLLVCVAALLAICLQAPPFIADTQAVTSGFSEALNDEQYWQMVTRFSERPGSFPSDNLLSNERSLQDVIPDLVRLVHPGRVFIGVGPEQNFTYILALKPSLAFIVDIRRGNLDLHLMYKALFELSQDRAEFVAKLFSKTRASGLTSDSTVTEIFDAYTNVETSEAVYVDTMRAIVNQLTKKHGFSLSADDMLRLQRTYRAFYTHGPAIQYSSTRNSGRRDEPTYRDLMVAKDKDGIERSYLASEEAFAFIKRFETDNLLVPIIGNFAGSKAIRAVGQYLADKGATVSAFYVSNVEEYLRRDGAYNTFCSNLSTLPVDESSTLIRSVRADVPSPGFRLDSELKPMASAVQECQ